MDYSKEVLPLLFWFEVWSEVLNNSNEEGRGVESEEITNSSRPGS
jgi:hypothetical protein